MTADWIEVVATPELDERTARRARGLLDAAFRRFTDEDWQLELTVELVCDWRAGDVW